MKTSLLIRRLPGLDESQIDDALEVYLEYTPKVLATITGLPLDRLCIGYQSPEGETIPSLCVLSQKTFFHTLYPRRQPTHVFSLQPGTIAGYHQLNLTASLADATDNDIITEHRLTVSCNPVSNTELTLTRSHANKGLVIALETAHVSDAILWYAKQEAGTEVTLGLSVENLSSFRCELSAARAYQKTSHVKYQSLANKPTKVTLFAQNSNNAYLYLNYLPQQIDLTWLPENQGWLEINTSAETLEQVGFCNDLFHPTFQVYVSNLSATGRITWNLTSIDCLDTGRLHLMSTEAISTIHLDATKDPPGSATVSLDIESKPRLDATVSWNLSQEYFCIEQSRMDLSIALVVITPQGSTFAGSCVYLPQENGSLTIRFAPLFADDIGFGLSGSSFIIQNMTAFFAMQGLGNLTIRMDRVVKQHEGNITFTLSGVQEGETILCNCSLEVTGGVEITNLSIGYNGAWHNASSVIVEDQDTLYFVLSASLNVSYEFADDLSWGYISLSGSLYMNLDITLVWNGTQGGITGELMVESLDDAFVISWKTINGTRFFTLNGSSLVSLTAFRAWFGELFAINIPYLHGNLMLKNVSNQQGFFSLTFQGSGFLHLNTSFSSENESDTEILFSLNTEIASGSSPATVAAGWDQHNITIIELDVLDGGHLVVNNCSLVVIEDSNVSLRIENLTASFTGYFLRMVLPTNSSNTTMRSTLNDAEISLHIDTINLSSSELDLGEFIFISQVQGTATFSLVNYTNESCINKTAVEDLMWHNFTIDIDANNSHFILDTLYIEHLANYSTVEMHNLSIQNGSTRLILHAAVNQNVTAARFIYASFNNSPHTTMFLDSFSFDLVLQDIPPLPTTLYSGVLVDGLFEFHLRLFDIIAFTIFNGSAIDHLGVNITPPEETGSPDVFLHTVFEDSVDYLKVDFKLYPSEHLIIDTHNTTARLDMSFIISTPSGENIGYRFDDVQLQADRFFLHMPDVYEDPENASTDEFYIEGYLHVDGEGTLWMLLNGVWQPLYPYIGTLILRPGHLTLEATGEIELNYTTTLLSGDVVTLAGIFRATHCLLDIFWNETMQTTALIYNGSLDVEAFLFEIEYNTTGGESRFSLSSGSVNVSIPTIAALFINGSSYEMHVPEGTLSFEEFKTTRINASEQVLDSSWNSLSLIGPAHVHIDLTDKPQFSLCGSAESLHISAFSMSIPDEMLEFDTFSFSGSLNLTTLPEKSGLSSYAGINIAEFTGVLTVDAIASSVSPLDSLDSVYFEGTGDIHCERWDYADDTHMFLQSQQGSALQSFSVTLDDGQQVELTHKEPGDALIGPGYIHLEWNIDLDADGFVFLDSSSITLENVQVSYKRDRWLGWGIRLESPSGYVDADEWCMQWDPLVYLPNLGVFIPRPLSIVITGSISHGDSDIDISDGNYWYNLWPLLS